MTDFYALHRDRWRWNTPTHFNIGDAVCTRHAMEPTLRDRIAIHWESEHGETATISYATLHARAAALSASLRALGVGEGDKVAVALPQRIETAIAHIAIYRLGAVAVPLTVLFGPDALEYRLNNAEVSVLIGDDVSLANVATIRENVPGLRTTIGIGALGDHRFNMLAPTQAVPPEIDVYSRPTDANAPALIIYTSGTTGPPKGTLIAHRSLLGNLSGMIYSHNVFPQPGDVFWSPADWAWTGGLIDVLLPCLYYGVPLVGYQGRFDPVKAFELMQKYGVRNTFLFPTALKAMMKAVPAPREHYDLKLRSIMSAGEAVGETVYAWTRDALGVTLNEMFGQTELNYIVGNCNALWSSKPGAMGRGYPGHRVGVIDPDGNEVKPGETGEVALHRLAPNGESNPVVFLEYWRNPTATQEKYTGDWACTGDVARIDDDGYLWYEGRADDVIKSAGYRIGPAEIENCLIKHPAVANAAVIGKPDAERGAIIKAFIVLQPDQKAKNVPTPQLVESLQQHVKARLAQYEAPKEFEFIEALPMTTTGKVQRKVLRDREAAKLQS
jgi:acetyl-CoA synthetase